MAMCWMIARFQEGKSIFLCGVILGWTEGLQLIGEGDEIELVIPPNLGYGNEGTRGGVTEVPGASLSFVFGCTRCLRTAEKTNVSAEGC